MEMIIFPAIFYQFLTNMKVIFCQLLLTFHLLQVYPSTNIYKCMKMRRFDAKIKEFHEIVKKRPDL